MKSRGRKNRKKKDFSVKNLGGNKRKKEDFSAKNLGLGRAEGIFAENSGLPPAEMGAGGALFVVLGGVNGTKAGLLQHGADRGQALGLVTHGPQFRP